MCVITVKHNIANANLNTQQRRSPIRKALEFPCSLGSQVCALISCWKAPLTIRLQIVLRLSQLTDDVDKSKIDFAKNFIYFLILNISFNILASVGHFFGKYDNKMSVWKWFVFSVRAPKRKYFKLFSGKKKPAKTMATLRPYFLGCLFRLESHTGN